jgi:hypothetical protein
MPHAIDLSGGTFGRWTVLVRGSLAGQERPRLVAVPLRVRERANRGRQGAAQRQKQELRLPIR